MNVAAAYLGGTTINTGSLNLRVFNALNSAGALSINGGELALGQTEQHVGAVLLNGGSITGGSLTGTSYAINSG
ncbi:MAG: hypothetical protein EBS42_14000, partial [Caulobacteraceae bacterium]|nr:hypothetical protein [Caulobacteraceae bacterium]